MRHSCVQNGIADVTHSVVDSLSLDSLSDMHQRLSVLHGKIERLQHQLLSASEHIDGLLHELQQRSSMLHADDLLAKHRAKPLLLPSEERSDIC